MTNMFVTKSRRAVPEYTKPKLCMEPKKNPKYDIHRHRGVLFNVSLAISLTLVITAFKWSVGISKKELRKPNDRHERIEMAVIPIVREKQKEVAAPKPIKMETPKPPLESINFKAVDDSHPIDEPKTGVIDQNSPPMIEISTGTIDLPKEKPDSLFIVVEKMPQPVGGWETFFKTLGKNIKYPRQAARSTVGGKVFVGFTVNEKGQLQDFSVVKGIGF